MKLSELERQSAVWLRLDAHLNEQLKACRQQNDGELDAIATSRLRGRISAIKQILSLGQQETVQAESD
jgi:hypothetical protein